MLYNLEKLMNTKKYINSTDKFVTKFKILIWNFKSYINTEISKTIWAYYENIVFQISRKKYANMLSFIKKKARKKY